MCTVLLLAILSGCMPAGPDYKEPQAPVPPAWSKLPENIAPTEIVENTQWWTSFNDPLLNSLIERAVKSNLDIRLAQERLREVRAMRGVAGADGQPTLNASTAYSRTRRSQNSTLVVGGKGGTSTPGGTSKSGGVSTQLETNYFQAGFDASWEMDLFGRVRRSVEAAEADVHAAMEAHHAAIVTLLGEVARNYIELRGAQAQIAMVNKNLILQQDTLELSRIRFNAGLVNALDIIRTEAQVATTKSQIPTFENSVAQAIHRLSVLLGQEPVALETELVKEAPIPAPPAQMVIGVPADLLRRRPDICKAERELAAATARVGVATADLYPRFVLSGSISLQSIEFSNWIDKDSRAWSFGPNITLPIFDAGRIRQNIKIQDARQEQALTLYEQTLISALEDVENALSAYSREQTRLQTLNDAVTANRITLDMANELYSKGLTDFFNVLDAERSLLASQSEIVKSQAIISSQVVALYKALGGGWESVEDIAASSKQ